MKFSIAVSASILIFALAPAAGGQSIDAQSIAQRYIDAQNRGDLEAALELWADDGMIINTRGRSIAGKENLSVLLREISAARFIKSWNRSRSSVARYRGSIESPTIHTGGSVSLLYSKTRKW